MGGEIRPKRSRESRTHSWLDSFQTILLPFSLSIRKRENKILMSTYVDCVPFRIHFAWWAVKWDNKKVQKLLLLQTVSDSFVTFDLLLFLLHYKRMFQLVRVNTFVHFRVSKFHFSSLRWQSLIMAIFFDLGFSLKS